MSAPDVIATRALRKLKPLPDEDARVMAYLQGKGRHAGRMGALLLQMANGQRFALGTGFSDVQRDTPPPVGVGDAVLQDAIEQRAPLRRRPVGIALHQA